MKFINFKIIVYFGLFLILTSKISAQSLGEINDQDFFIGKKNAPITIIEYSSLSCVHCASFHSNTLDLLKTEYIDTGKVKFAFRDFPFNFPALLGSMILQCIPSESRYEYMNALFLLQKTWVSRDNKKTTDNLYKIMQSGGMTKDEFDNCIKDTDLENKILTGVMLAQEEFKISSTPSFIINGALVSGNLPIKEFRQILNKILSE